MSFLSDDQYALLRSDPSQILNIYDQVRTQFVADLNMPGLDEDAIIAAFCSVVAYGAAPYGAEPATTDLSVLLNAPSLACDDYVLLTWRLIEAAGISTDNQISIGFDDGVVGNHAEMLVSVGGNSLLLDPTIGLVVDGVTLEGLVSGTSYTQVASFYDRNDITSFQQTVIRGIREGLNRLQDVTYYEPTLTNYLNDRASYILPPPGEGAIIGASGHDLIYGANGDATLFGGLGGDGTSFYEAQFSGSSSQYAITDQGESGYQIAGPDGIYQIPKVNELAFEDQIVSLIWSQNILSDTPDQYAWTDIVNGLDWKGRTLFTAYDNDDGSRIVYNYDVLNQFDWSSTQTTLDSQSHRTKVLYNGDDGGSTLYQFDVSNSEPWSNVTFYADSQGRSNLVQYDEDDGSHVVYQFDVQNTATWKHITHYYNSNLQPTQIVYDMDDGSIVGYEYDTSNQKAWSRIQTNYDSQSRATEVVYDQRDGTHVAYFNDVDNQYSWSTMIERFDSQWNLLGTSFTPDKTSSS